jgi:hypothetical protein
MRKLIAAITVAALAVTTAPLPAAPVPTAETVIEHAVEALGGRAALAKLQTRVLYGAMEIPGLGIKAPMTIWQARPALKYAEMSSSATGEIVSGCDGETCWQNTSLQGPRIERNGELALSLRDSDFDGLANWQQWYSKAVCAGADSAAGTTAWKVLMTPNEGEPETWWFDQSSGLPVKESMTVVNEMGNIALEAYPSDYRRVAGILVPFRTRQVLMGGVQTMVMVVDSIATNVKIPSGRFDLPPEIRALKAKQSGANPAPADSAGAPWGRPAREDQRK